MENKKLNFNDLPNYKVRRKSIYADGKDTFIEVKVVKTKYSYGDNLALILFEKNGEEFDTITVNIEGADFEEAKDKLAYLDTNNCSFAEEFITSNKLGESLYCYGFSGFCSYPLYAIYVDKIADYEDIDWETVDRNAGLKTVKVYDIDYCVEDEDLDDIDEDSSKEEIEEKIAKIKARLPKTLWLYDCEEDEMDESNIDEYLGDKISEETGWLVNSFQYEIVGG